MENLRALLERHAESESPDDLALCGHGTVRLTLGDLKEVYALAETGQKAVQRNTEIVNPDEPTGPRTGPRAPIGARRPVA